MPLPVGLMGQGRAREGTPMLGGGGVGTRGVGVSRGWTMGMLALRVWAGGASNGE